MVRVGLIRRAADGGGEGVPACSLADALAAVNQVIDDMEDRLAPPDRHARPLRWLSTTHHSMVCKRYVVL